MNFLELEFLIWLNKYMVLRHGGSFYAGDRNVLNRNSLEYLVEAVQHLPTEDHRAPPVYTLAAEYAHRIITRHVFHDGNKRTGMEAMLVSLRSNGVVIDVDPMSHDLVSIATDVAEGRAGVPELVRWIREHVAEQQ